MKNANNKTGAPVELDQLLAENEILKIKLHLEFGMDLNVRSTLNAREENTWLNSIYEMERHFKECRHIKVYERLGRPTVKELGTLNAEQIDVELQGLFLLMQEHGVALDFKARYEKSVLYKFITEELFEQEMEDLDMHGFVTHFLYEQFHPNHELDLKMYSDEFIELLFGYNVSGFDARHFADPASFNGRQYDHKRILDVVHDFQQIHFEHKIECINIGKVEFDLKTGRGEVHALVNYSSRENGAMPMEGSAKIEFVYELEHWFIAAFHFSGVS